MTRDKVVKVHSNTSRRANPREGGDRKIVFRSVLDNPHRVSWPSVPMNMQNSILAHLIDLLDGVAEYRRKSSTGTKKRKREATDDDSSLTRNTKRVAEGTSAPDQKSLPEAKIPSDATENPQRPPILNHLTYGINEVTKRLESQIEDSKSKSVLRSASGVQVTQQARPVIKYVLVCRADVNPPVLIDHLPHLVAAYNVLRQSHLPATILASLPQGAESVLANVIGVRRIAVLAIDSDFSAAIKRLQMIDALPLVTAPWMGSLPARCFVQTHIKQLRTTAPRDMKAAKEARMRGKAAARTRHKLINRSEAMETESGLSLSTGQSIC